ncbi:hypothetical protein D3C71_1574120 [compost metagenome]
MTTSPSKPAVGVKVISPLAAKLTTPAPTVTSVALVRLVTWSAPRMSLLPSPLLITL